MNELIEKIKEVSEVLLVDAAAQAEKGNKAAGTRARKASLDLEKLLKEFRKLSLEESKMYSVGKLKKLEEDGLCNSSSFLFLTSFIWASRQFFLTFVN